MRDKKTARPATKSQLHPRNKHRQRYDFPALISSCPELTRFVADNQYGDASIDFFNPDAVRCLNKALLKHFYAIDGWSIPKNNLCPPIPGRVDYVHYLADLLATSSKGSIPTGKAIRCIDIGVGANCVYPLVGASEYDWSFVGSDIEAASLRSAGLILAANPQLERQIDLCLQTNKKAIFNGIIQADERFELSICNPPFHRSAAEAKAGTQRKQTNLKASVKHKDSLNFGGQSNELWCPGGELSFIKNMISESQQFSAQVLWFTSLVSKEANLKAIYQALKQQKVAQFETIKMGQGNKVSRFVAWTYQKPEQQAQWLLSS
ncbi:MULTISPECIES: 23S rRNA (adenine(1618)-N(6))-methyltransferase RlmF [unclassified Agarivorans]|uniref:23S rRNA (adenine(1618)-N(6))-methyltransferase RlmF n=1 Tax=unclassified Agarivorans TaxID=2636026 RepID=UPI0026E371F5|nr:MULTISPECIES: 23S rRNA (adenine(1618)-N(6))-methyltransferase RlmF [unclassified Agarivorans]MDO6686485.1 23S rRNA (adenine(1618)-N(6))-methyltransferase RlmF [Agarivorans sp. 3_MG-2023]MDO6715303.1 23S rRNA (adenine(1618)-N(6))-methyltransferase RlmF [Agarivorans sp. 2_MG-2023]